MSLTKITLDALGSSITINADALTSGTVPLNRLSAANSSANGIVTTSGQTFAGDKTFQNTVTVTGNLTVLGTSVTLNSENVLIKDNILTLNSNVTGSPVLDAGIEVNRGTSANVTLKWNETSDLWQLTNDGTNYGDLLTTLSSTGVNASALSTGTVPLARLTSANTSANGVVDTTTQTFAGLKTFNSNATFSGSRTFFASGSVLDWNSGDVTLTHSANTLTFGGASSGYVFSDGNVGIGVTPTGSFHVERASTDNILSAVGQTGYEGVLYLSGAGSGKDTSIVVGNGRNLNFKTTATATPTASGTTAMTLTGSNNLGIGTTSPNKAGFTKAVTIESDGQTGFEIVGSKTTDAALGNIVWINAANSYAYMGQVSVRRDGADNSGALTFSTWNSGTGAERMRITSSGNVGIGVTPSAWNTANKVLQIGDRMALWNTGTTGFLAYNTFVDSVGNFKYIATAAVSVVDITSGVLRFYNAPSGTAGNTATITERFQIDSSGNVGIGVTPTEKLDVNGHVLVRGTRIYQSNAGGNVFEIGPGAGSGDATVWGFYAPASRSIGLFAGGAERLRITSGGDVAIAATAKLYLDGVAATGDSYLSEAGANVIRVTVGGVSAVQWDTTGMYLNTAPPTSASAANAVVGSGSDYLRRSTSSIRYKHDIATLDTHDALAAVMAMRPVTYRGKTDEDQRRFVGFIAEEMQEIAPLLCTYDEGGESGTPNYVTYDRVTAYLVAVVQQQQQKIAALEARLATLEG